MVVVTLFVKGLLFLQENELDTAATSLTTAIQQVEADPDLEGIELLYLLASHIANLQGDPDEAQRLLDLAFHHEPDYARGYIAQGNIHYYREDEPNLFAAQIAYEHALSLPEPLTEAYIFEKGHLGLGNVCFKQFIAAQALGEASDSELIGLAEEAWHHYELVIGANDSIAEDAFYAAICHHPGLLANKVTYFWR